MNWFERMKSGILTRIKREIPDGIWSKCPACGEATYQHALERNNWICPQCGFHFPIGHAQYVDLLLDQGTWEETESAIATADPLRFRDHRRYSDRIKEARRKSDLAESICTGVGRLGGHPVALGVMDTRYILGSLGGATGEKICRLIDRAIADRRSLVLVCQSGGARMQESTYSLMQMAKVSARLRQLSDAGLLYVTVLTDPTYGGVTASFASLGDILLAEPGARVGFAGQAVIKQFLGLEELPDGFQIAETVLEHGFVDRVVPRGELPPTLARLIAMLAPSDCLGRPPVAAPEAPSLSLAGPAAVDVARIGLMAALTAVGAHLRLPLPYVPVTLQVAFVCLAGLWLGPWRGAASQLAYLAAGLVGFPVFAAGGGPQYVLEPSFGFLAGFVPGAFLAGYLGRGTANLLRAVLAAYAGIAAIYAVGVAYLAVILLHVAAAPLAGSTVARAGLAPLPKDLVLGLGAAWLSRRLQRAGLGRP